MWSNENNTNSYACGDSRIAPLHQNSNTTADDNTDDVCHQCGVKDNTIFLSKNSLKLANTKLSVSVQNIGYKQQPARILNSGWILKENVDLKCLQLADTTLNEAPLHLRQLLIHLQADDYSNAEYLLMLIYIVAVETGFCLEKQCMECLKSITDISGQSLFHSKNVITLTHGMPSYRHNEDKTQFIMHFRTIINVNLDNPTLLHSFLNCYVTGELMIVTLTPHKDLRTAGYSICLSIGRYVLNFKRKNQPLFTRFRKLNELTAKLRDNIFLPIRNCQMSALNIFSYPGLLGLPYEIIYEIFRHLTEDELKNLSEVHEVLYYYVGNHKYFLKNSNKNRNI